MYTKTISIPHIEIEDAIIQTLIANGHIDPNDNVDGVDLGLSLNEHGYVEFDLEYYDDGDTDVSNDEPDTGPYDGSSIDWLKRDFVRA